MSEFKNKKTQINDLETLLKLSASKAFERFYGFHPNTNIEDPTKEKPIKYPNARKWWEPTDPTTQCNNTIGNIKDNIASGIKCYICGLDMPDLSSPPIKSKGNKRKRDSSDKDIKCNPARQNPIDNCSPECEHVLPVYQSALLLDLYNPKLKKSYEDADMDIFKLEYKWSHSCCNQIKNDDSFLTVKPNKNNSQEFTLNNEQLKTTLKNIYRGKHSSCSNNNPFNLVLKQKYKNENDFLRQRIRNISEETMTPIIQYLSSRKNGGKGNRIGLFYLSILSKILLSVDQNHLRIAQGNSPIKQPLNLAVLKIEIYSDICDNILLNILNATSGDNIEDINTIKQVKNIDLVNKFIVSMLDSKDNNFNNTNTKVLRNNLKTYLISLFNFETTNYVSERMIFQDVFMYLLGLGMDKENSSIYASYALRFCIVSMFKYNIEKNQQNLIPKREGRRVSPYNSMINLINAKLETLTGKIDIDNNASIFIKSYVANVIQGRIDPTPNFLNHDLLLNNRISFFNEYGENYNEDSENTKNIDEQLKDDLNNLEISATIDLINLKNNLTEQLDNPELTEQEKDEVIYKTAELYGKSKNIAFKEINDIDVDNNIKKELSEVYDASNILMEMKNENNENIVSTSGDISITDENITDESEDNEQIREYTQEEQDAALSLMGLNNDETNTKTIVNKDIILPKFENMFTILSSNVTRTKIMPSFVTRYQGGKKKMNKSKKNRRKYKKTKKNIKKKNATKRKIKKRKYKTKKRS